MKVEEILKKYDKDISHSKNVSRLSLLLFHKLKHDFVFLQNYDNKNDLALLEIGAMLHDIGIYFEDYYSLSHHKASAKFILEHNIDGTDEKDKPVLACLARYHRKSLPDENKHRLYKSLNQKDKAKVLYLGSIIRLSDAMDCLHINLVENFNLEYDKQLYVLTLTLDKNIMLNDEVFKTLEKKKDFFEFAYKTKLNIKG